MQITLIKKLIKRHEDQINKKLDKSCNTFSIVHCGEENSKVIFNGECIAWCETLEELECVTNTIIFFLEGGLKK